MGDHVDDGVETQEHRLHTQMSHESSPNPMPIVPLMVSCLLHYLKKICSGVSESKFLLMKISRNMVRYAVNGSPLFFEHFPECLYYPAA